MKRKIFLPLVGALMLGVLSACSSKMGALSSDYFTVTPQVLEAHQRQVPGEVFQ